MTTQHTPGPWRVAPDQASHGEKLCIVDADDEIIARTPASLPDTQARNQDEANAALLAASPELLDLAQTVASGNTEYADLQEMALAVISKIEGRS